MNLINFGRPATLTLWGLHYFAANLHLVDTDTILLRVSRLGFMLLLSNDVLFPQYIGALAHTRDV